MEPLNLVDLPPNREAIAAALTSAVHMHLLRMQLQGQPVSLAEAIESVRDTWWQLMNNESLNQMLRTMPTELRPTVTDEVVTDPGPGMTVRKTVQGHTGSFLTPVNVPPIGLRIDGRYRIVRELGEGGMGKVFLAEQLGTGRPIAIKLMTEVSLRQSAGMQRYFRQEAEALARLNHQNIAQIYDAAQAPEGFYIAMEYVPGESLRRRLRREPRLPVDLALHILKETCLGLATAHQHGIIHRDLKPENLMLSDSVNAGWGVKILDFGLAIVDNRDADDNITAANNVAGTITYMSPEQLSGSRLTPATDVYSLGLIAYEMLTGRNPFMAGTPALTARNHFELIPSPIREAVSDISASLETAIFKALEKDPGARFSTAGDFLKAL